MIKNVMFKIRNQVVSFFLSYKNGSKGVKIFNRGKLIYKMEKHSVVGSGTIIFNDNAVSFQEKTKLIIDHGGKIIIEGEVRMYTNSYIHCGDKAEIVIGNNTYFNDGLKISSKHRICIGSNCAISNDVTIMDSDFHIIENEDNVESGVCIGNHVWIGANCIILKNVKVGDNCIIGAGAIVTQSIPDNSVAAGVPAKVIRQVGGWQ